MLETIIIPIILSVSPVPDYEPYINHLNENKITNIWTKDVTKKTNVIEEMELCIKKILLKKWVIWYTVLRDKPKQSHCFEKEIQLKAPKRWYNEVDKAK